MSAIIHNQITVSTTPYTIDANNSGTTHILTGASAQTINLPAIYTGLSGASTGSYYLITNQGANAATLIPVTGQTVGGNSSLSIPSQKTVSIELCGTDWSVI